MYETFPSFYSKREIINLFDPNWLFEMCMSPISFLFSILVGLISSSETKNLAYFSRMIQYRSFQLCPSISTKNPVKRLHPVTMDILIQNTGSMAFKLLSIRHSRTNISNVCMSPLSHLILSYPFTPSLIYRTPFYNQNSSSAFSLICFFCLELSSLYITTFLLFLYFLRLAKKISFLTSSFTSSFHQAESFFTASFHLSYSNSL